MANVLHRTTKQYRTSVDPTELPEPIANYIVGPDLSTVTGQPTKYWITQAFPDDTVTLMDQAARDAVDAAEQATRVTNSRAKAIATQAKEFSGQVTEGTQFRALVELLNKRDNFNTNRIIELQDQMAAIVASNGNAQAIRDAVEAISNSTTNTRPRPEAFTDYDDIINSGQADS